ncbi:MAG: hypothetical protein IJV75_03035 [Alphaproteobacteria bacterium]|nr:hypothetical protein [Alphaproteobacteria bacterium]MBR6675088.1 hypothetical protein [Alphaproteobacteria bacterium]
MERLKSALNALEGSVIKLEAAIHQAKKKQINADEKIAELKTVIKTTYERLDKAVSDYKKGGV